MSSRIIASKSYNFLDSTTLGCDFLSCVSSFLVETLIVPNSLEFKLFDNLNLFLYINANTINPIIETKVPTNNASPPVCFLLFFVKL